MDEKKQSKVDKNSLHNNKALSNISDTSMLSSYHCPYRQASLLQQALAPDKMKVAFFLGAGCPTAIRISSETDASTNTKPLIPDILGLTNKIQEEIESTDHKKALATIMKRISGNSSIKVNIEDILSHIRLLQEVVGNSTIDGLSLKCLTDLETKICEIATTLVQVHLPGDATPYHQLATWIRGILRAHPVEIFTSNYDLLMEQALEERRVPYFDGFVGSDRAFFDLSSIEQDQLPSRWARLWKVHGSINWWRTSQNNVERSPTGKAGDRQLIYPSHLKYDQSRRMPYLAMIDRLRAFLVQGQVVLVTCGYSFSDQHLNDAILQGLSGNPNAMCFGLIYGDLKTIPSETIAQARKYPNLSLLAVDGAILGTLERPWRQDEKADHPMHRKAVQFGDIENRTKAPTDQCKFLLGDFSSLGDFLAGQLAQVEEDENGDNNA